MSYQKIYMLIVCSYHVTSAVQRESTLYSCLKVKELHARSRLEIWSLSDFKGNWTHNHLVRKQTFNHIAKLAWNMPVWLNGWMFVYELSGCCSSHLYMLIYCLFSDHKVSILLTNNLQTNWIFSKSNFTKHKKDMYVCGYTNVRARK